jgi:MFS family permease
MISSYSIKHLYLLLTASGLSLIGTSITWSGIPFYLFKENNLSFQIGFTFIAFQLAEFIVSAFLNKYIFKYNKKSIYFGSLLLSGMVMCLMAFVDSGHSANFFILCLFFLLSSSAGSICKNIWIFEIIKSIHLSDKQKPFALSNLIEIFGKLIGFALGPFVFFCLGQKAFIIDGISYFIEAAMILIIPTIRINNSHKPTLYNAFCFIKKYYPYFVVSLLTQLFFLPLNLIVFHILLEKLKVNHYLMSYFSASTFIATILFNLIFVKISKFLKPGKAIYAICCLGLYLIFVGLLFTQNYTSFVAISVITSLFLLPLMIMFNSCLIRSFNQEDLNIFKIIEASVNSLIVCLALIFVNLVDVFSLSYLIGIAFIAFLIITARIYYFGLMIDKDF